MKHENKIKVIIACAKLSEVVYDCIQHCPSLSVEKRANCVIDKIFNVFEIVLEQPQADIKKVSVINLN